MRTSRDPSRITEGFTQPSNRCARFSACRIRLLYSANEEISYRSRASIQAPKDSLFRAISSIPYFTKTNTIKLAFCFPNAQSKNEIRCAPAHFLQSITEANSQSYCGAVFNWRSFYAEIHRFQQCFTYMLRL